VDHLFFFFSLDKFFICLILKYPILPSWQGRVSGFTNYFLWSVHGISSRSEYVPCMRIWPVNSFYAPPVFPFVGCSNSGVRVRWKRHGAYQRCFKLLNQQLVLRGCWRGTIVAPGGFFIDRLLSAPKFLCRPCWWLRHGLISNFC